MFNLIKPFVIFGLVVWIGFSLINIVKAGNVIAASKASIMTIVVWFVAAVLIIAVSPGDFVEQYRQKKTAERAPLADNYSYWKKRCESKSETFRSTSCKSASDAKSKLDTYDKNQ